MLCSWESRTTMHVVIVDSKSDLMRVFLSSLMNKVNNFLQFHVG